MEIIKTDIPDVVIIEPRVFLDERGYFYESFNQKEFEEKVGKKINFVQDNQSKSSYGVVRGLHFQLPPHAQTKLVRCVKGKIVDFAVDLRKDSTTYGKYVAVELSEENHRQLFIPKGFAHGFSTQSEEAIVQYKCDDFYCKECEGGIYILDEELNIPLNISGEDIILSDKDTKWKPLKELNSSF